GGQQVAVGGDREGRDAEVRHAPIARCGEHLLLVAALPAAVVLDRRQGRGRARRCDGTGACGGEGGGRSEQAAAGRSCIHQGFSFIGGLLVLAPEGRGRERVGRGGREGSGSLDRGAGAAGGAGGLRSRGGRHEGARAPTA